MHTKNDKQTKNATLKTLHVKVICKLAQDISIEN